MERSRCFTGSQIIAVLKQIEGGSPVLDLLQQHGISSATGLWPRWGIRAARRR